ncbi:putative nucleotidyltransferase [Aminobacter lissarensis]|uniref:Nucleotidyltransferase n=1 Tax=Aminobacter carboxidus TaxID=376165 RepID=A0A8E1WCQ3_9HYPH|nr:hypothetical protein [Aminobacter lissarensis]MBB6465584.1 putative nucleotidyltransferase [Aminobacter lissarensis]
MVFKDHERDLIEELINAGVDFAVIGGAAVVLHDHERERPDLDLLIDPNPGNLDRLEDVDVTWLHFSDRKIADLKKPGALLEMKNMGLDILTEMKGVSTTESIAERIFVSADGLMVPVISLDHLIQAKRAAGEDKDMADVEALEAMRGLPLAMPREP